MCFVFRYKKNGIKQREKRRETKNDSAWRKEEIKTIKRLLRIAVSYFMFIRYLCSCVVFGVCLHNVSYTLLLPHFMHTYMHRFTIEVNCVSAVIVAGTFISNYK